MHNNQVYGETMNIYHMSGINAFLMHKPHATSRIIHQRTFTAWGVAPINKPQPLATGAEWLSAKGKGKSKPKDSFSIFVNMLSYWQGGSQNAAAAALSFTHTHTRQRLSVFVWVLIAHLLFALLLHARRVPRVQTTSVLSILRFNDHISYTLLGGI